MKVNDCPKETERAQFDLAATVEEMSATRERIKPSEVEALGASRE